LFVLYNSKSLVLFSRLLVLLLSLFAFNASALYLSLDNNNLSCLDNDCSVKLKIDQTLRLSKDKRVVEVIEEDKDGKEKLISYLFYTTDINDLVAYSGKPLEVLVSLRDDGIINDLKLIKHSEPILLTGIPIEKLLEAVSFYKGKNINNKINIGEDVSGEIGIPIIAGATVTSLILHETILGTSRDVGRLFNFFDDSDVLEGGLNNKFNKFSWEQLLDINAVKHYCLDSLLRENDYADQDDLLVDIYFADLRHPSIGRNLLGDVTYKELIDELEDDKSAIMILNNGSWSFKGSGFVRGGIFDRFRVEQGSNIFTFRDNEFKNIYDLESVDVDDFRETGMFIISHAKYKPFRLWKLVLLLNYKTFTVDYNMPKSFCVIPDPLWLKSWKAKSFYISLYLGLWFFSILVFIFRYRLSRNSFNLSVIYNIILLLDIYIIGVLFEGQPSVVNIFALVDDIKNIGVFLLDPCIFLGWIMIVSTIFLWGKSLFCGWICPFGALQEIMFKVRSLIFGSDKSIELSASIMDKLRYVRYIIFFLLTLISFKNFEQAEFFAEIEPFKTMWILGIVNRSLWASIYTVFLLGIALVTYRFFCRFICPLGAFLSLLSILTIFRLRRRGTCVACGICDKTCNSRAIDKLGAIDSKECFGCFTCVNNLYNPKVCPPITSEKLRHKYEKGVFWK